MRAKLVGIAMAVCARNPFERIETARWPVSLEPWLDAGLRQRMLPPQWAPECAASHASGDGLKIIGLSDGEILRRAQGNDIPRARLEIRGGREEVSWMVNGRLLARSKPGARQIGEFPLVGRYDITAFDDHGRYDRLSVSVHVAR